MPRYIGVVARHFCHYFRGIEPTVVGLFARRWGTTNGLVIGVWWTGGAKTQSHTVWVFIPKHQSALSLNIRVGIHSVSSIHSAISGPILGKHGSIAVHYLLYGQVNCFGQVMLDSELSLNICDCTKSPALKAQQRDRKVWKKEIRYE